MNLVFSALSDFESLIMKLEHLQRRKLPFFFFRCSFPYCICSPLRLFNHYYKVDFSSNEKSSHEGNLRGASKILRADHTNFEALKKGKKRGVPKAPTLFSFFDARSSGSKKVEKQICFAVKILLPRRLDLSCLHLSWERFLESLVDKLRPLFAPSSTLSRCMSVISIHANGLHFLKGKKKNGKS